LKDDAKSAGIFTDCSASPATTRQRCITIGWLPGPLYALLPYPTAYEPYADLGHSITQLQLLLFAALAFAVLVRTGLYPPEKASITLDTDWLYRRLARASRQTGRYLMRWVLHHYGAEGTLARAWPTGSMVLWVAILLGTSLILYYL
jgi:multicomponent Na+:H+ antiporter subunit D